MPIRSINKKALSVAIVIGVLCLIAGAASAQDQSEEVRELRKEMRELRNELRNTLAEKQKKIEQLEDQVRALQTKPVQKQEAKTETASAQSALDKALSGLDQYREQTQKGELISRPIGGGATLRLMDISLDVLFASGASTARDPEIEILQGGGHDPKRRGFTLNQAEIGLVGAVDPYFTAESYIVFTEEGVELEEAYFKTSSLPHGLQLKGGFFLTEFGIINQTHPHAWDWIDQPIINSRLLGGDGTRGPGARLGWLTPLPWFSEFHVGMQNSNNETMVSFRGAREGNLGALSDPGIPTTIGGRPVAETETASMRDMLYSARWENSFDLGRETTTKFGFSGLFGPNNTGSDGFTSIYGADLKVKWQPESNEAGRHFLIWQSEIMARDYQADAVFANGQLFPETTLHDWGFYSQLLCGFHRNWAAGLRFEYASGSNESVLIYTGRDTDPFRDDRYRLSPMLSWSLSEFARFRLQYNYDYTDHLEHHEAHSVWIGTEFLIGSHPAHKY